jgi:hypothetical protein
MVIWGMVYYCVNHVTHGQLIDVCEYVDGLWKVTPPAARCSPKVPFLAPDLQVFMRLQKVARLMLWG